MKQNNMLAMILAGGRGSRLHDLTSKVAKPAVSYGGKYRIIDFPLSNCANSGIDVVGVLTQYESILLNSYVAAGGRWGLDAKESGGLRKDGVVIDTTSTGVLATVSNLSLIHIYALLIQYYMQNDRTDEAKNCLLMAEKEYPDSYFIGEYKRKPVSYTHLKHGGR